MSYDDNNGAANLYLIPLELSDELKQEAIVTRFDKDTRTGSLLLSLNHKYNKKNIVFPISSAKKVDWVTLLEKMAKRLRTSGVSADHILMIEDVLNTNYEKVFWEADNSSQDNPRDKQKEAYYVRKYTANGTLPLHESVIFADSGQAAFVYLDCNDDYKLKTANYIERPDKILYPADNMDSQNPPPYVFASVEELKMYFELAKAGNFRFTVSTGQLGSAKICKHRRTLFRRDSS